MTEAPTQNAADAIARRRARRPRSRWWPWLVGLGGCATNPHQPPPDETTRSFSVQLGPDVRVLELRVANGRVAIAHGDVPTCEVAACVRAGSPTEARQLAASVELVPDDDDADGVHVVAVHSPRAASLELVNLCIVVQAPPDLALRVLTQRAAVVVQGYKGHLSVDSDSGDVAARLDGGEAEIRTRSGGIRLSGTFARVAVEADGGAVQVVLPAEAVQPSVAVTTQGGDVTVEVPQASRVAFSARVRSGRGLPCEPEAQWEQYGADDGDRWRLFRGEVGAAEAVALSKSTVRVVSESGRVALRSLPGS